MNMNNETNLFGILREEQNVNPENELLIQKEEEYKKYIDNHIKEVRVAFNNLITNSWINNSSNRDVKECLRELRENILNHDASKYSDEEFDAYRAYFYPVSDEEKENAKDDWERATKHHYEVNKHHPEHWIIDGVPQDMPIVYILELMCDWEAMSKVGSSLVEFWNETKNTRWSKVMSQYTMDTIDRLIKLIYYKE